MPRKRVTHLFHIQQANKILYVLGTLEDSEINKMWSLPSEVHSLVGQRDRQQYRHFEKNGILEAQS